MEFDLENPLSISKEDQFDTISHLFISEYDHMPSRNFLQSLKANDFYVSFRQEAFSLILQAQCCCSFDPFVPYLAVNYMDRFISRRQIPQGKQWVLRILVVACISLALKLMNKPFSISDFQRVVGLMLDAQAINRMEILILNTLNWRMRPITPFSFLCFFISLFKHKDPPLTQALKDRATEIILKAQNEMELLEFKPSIIAGSSLLVASHELFPLQFPSFKHSISSCECVNKDKLIKCFSALQELVEMEWYGSMLDAMSSTRTPLSVLYRHCNMSESETTTTTTTLQKRDIKRRKTNECIPSK